jgi:hypothetical protein
MVLHQTQRISCHGRKHRWLGRFFVPCLLVAAGFLLLGQRHASAAVVLSLTLEDLVRQADLIVVGRCEHVMSAWDESGKKIFTYVTILPERCLKEMDCPSPVRLRILGGTIDNVAMSIAGTPRFEVNEGVILFLKRSSDAYYQVLGLSQGKFSIMHRKNTSYVIRNLRGLTLAKKEAGRYQLMDAQEKEWEVELDIFLRRIESYLTEKEE